MVKNSPANAEDVSLILGWDDPLEKEMATQFSFLFQENPMDRGAWQAIQSMRSQRVGPD